MVHAVGATIAYLLIRIRTLGPRSFRAAVRREKTREASMAEEAPKNKTVGSRREVLKIATGLAAGTAALRLPAGTAAAQAAADPDAATLERLLSADPTT